MVGESIRSRRPRRAAIERRVDSTGVWGVAGSAPPQDVARTLQSPPFEGLSWGGDVRVPRAYALWLNAITPVGSSFGLAADGFRGSPGIDEVHGRRLEACTTRNQPYIFMPQPRTALSGHPPSSFLLIGAHLRSSVLIRSHIPYADPPGDCVVWWRDGSTVRQAHGKPFDRLTASRSTGSRQAGFRLHLKGYGVTSTASNRGRRSARWRVVGGRENAAP